MRRAALGAALLACLAAAPARSDPPPPAPKPPAVAPADPSQQVVRVFEIRYRDVTDVSMLIEPHLSPTALLAVNKRTRTVKVIDSPEVVQAVADFIKQFDVPPHAVVVRIVLEKAERAAKAGADAFQDSAAWTFSPLAETTLEVLERGESRQVVGEDGAFEIHLVLGSVDPERHLMHFDTVEVSRRAAPSGAPGGGTEPAFRTLMSTALELEDGVGKVVMTARNESADVALVVRVKGLIREPVGAGGR